MYLSQGSDDGTLSGSSSDFVHLEDEEVVSYHHKEPVASPGGSRLQCDISEAMAATSVDESVTTTDADDTVVPSDGVNNLSGTNRSLCMSNVFVNHMTTLQFYLLTIAYQF